MLDLIDTSPLSRWEKGIALPNLVQIFRLARIYKTMPSEMYFELWQNISNEMSAKKTNLLTHHESFTSNEELYMKN